MEPRESSTVATRKVTTPCCMQKKAKSVRWSFWFLRARALPNTSVVFSANYLLLWYFLVTHSHSPRLPATSKSPGLRSGLLRYFCFLVLGFRLCGSTWGEQQIHILPFLILKIHITSVYAWISSNYIEASINTSFNASSTAALATLCVSVL
jgi:hypothetical protein